MAARRAIDPRPGPGSGIGGRGAGLASFLIVGLLAVASGAQDPGAPPDEPILRTEAGGPSGPVMGLAFSPDGRTLYEGGWDKVVRVWARDPEAGRFEADPAATYRVPVGPGSEGAINAIALSDDGRWLAAAGSAVVRGGAGFRRAGLMIPGEAMTDAMRLDRGTILVFDTRSRPRAARQLRGHLGPVLGLAFAPSSADGGPPALVSVAREGDPGGDLGALRLWDLGSGEELASVAVDPLNIPALAAWRSGPGPRQVRAALASDDGTLRIWDPGAAPDRLVAVADGRFNRAVSRDDRADRLVTGSFDAATNSGRLRTWSLGADARPVEDGRLRLVPGEGDRGGFLIPRAVAPCPSRPGGPADLAAVVVLRDPGRAPGPGDRMEYRLRLVDLAPTPDGVARVRKEVRLWAFSAEPPSLAVSPAGDRLAVAGNASRAIVVFEVADLLRGETRPQLLRGSGMPIGDAAFVRRGEDWGLRVDPTPPGGIGEPPRPPEAGSLVLDPGRRRLDAGLDGWVPSVPDVSGWEIRHAVGGRDAQGERVGGWVEVSRAGDPPRRIDLEPGHTLTALALRPPTPPIDAPIVAIASERSGEPSLSLFEGGAGERFRRLTGHAGRITALRFSGDGRLLASAAEDRTACVWGLIDLDRTIGRRGRLPGLAVTERDGGLVVSGVEPGTEAAGRLGEGDEVLGLVRDGGLDAQGSLFSFFNEVSMIRPGDPVTLRVRPEGAEARDVTLGVGQAVDERKPLFSLFLAGTEGRGEPGWIAWNPLGPYDSSGQEAERRLGWHFNTGDPAAPTRFAQADQFPEFRREGLVGELLERAALPPVAEAAPLPRPGLAIALDVPEQEGDDLPIVRLRPTTLRLVLLDEAVGPGQVARVEWSIDGSPAREMAPDGPRGWVAALDGAGWGRGPHAIRAVLHTREATPQAFEAIREVRYLPPAPVVAIEGPAQRVVDRPEYEFRASVDPRGGPATVRLVHRVGDEVRAERAWRSGEPIPVEQPITLAEGVNTIELVAVNDGAIEGLEGFETADPAPVVVVYDRREVPPPTITLDPVSTADGPSPSIVGGRPTVDRSRIVISASIRSDEPIDRAEWSRAGGEWRGLNPVPGVPGSYRLEADLEPGPNAIRVRAKSADSDFSEARAEVAFVPPVPEVVDLLLDPPGPVLVVAPDRDPPRIRLSGRLVLGADPFPFGATVIVNGEALAEPPEVDAGAGTLSAEVPIRPGENVIRVRLGNEWGGAWSGDPLVVSCRRPPEVRGVAHSEVGDEPVVDVTAKVASPPGLPVTRAVIRVEGEGPGLPARMIEDVSIEPEAEGSWTISAARVPISLGGNAISVLAWNADGRSPEPGRAGRVVYEAPPPSPPRVTILRPGRDATERVDRARVTFEVRSDDPIRSARLIRIRTEAEHETLIEADPAGAVREAGGGVSLRVDGEIGLGPGANLLRVEATTDRGATGSADVSIGYIPPPARVEVVGIEPKRGGGEPLRPAAGPDNRVSFPGPMATGQGWLVGRVSWADEEMLRTHEATRARIWVNRFPQSLATLRPVEGEPLVREFRAEVVFSREENDVSVELPGVPLDEADRPSFRVSCEVPEERQRLHLLIVGTGQGDREALRGRALEALHASPHPDAPGDPDRFRTPAFLDGVVYGPLLDDVRIMELVYQLDRIRREVDLGLALADRPIDVVAVYFQGNAWVEGEHAYFGLRRGNGRGRPESVSLDFLADQFAESRGFQLFLIDSRRPIEAGSPTITGVVGDYPPDRWPPSEHVHHVGILNQTWWHETDDGPPAEPGNEATLTASLEQAVAQGGQLGDVATYLRRGLDQLRERFENVTLEEHLPEPLADLNLGRASASPPGSAIDD
ncbi:WD40 repeat domain-containing protein [Tautonia plasticadhaerens]|uniref:WD domain, G-beta repeat n=1 Tax=Tautonia plasticadhaerens TaxID=2527974 RepID=A0A518GZG1_9BACT|nr:WD40 repeat domain-containing protein [Tautonia plasticadhaerens]QDV33987.1 WD domain, G-beta repeat [Tautonia plasticadhaerens]